MITVFNQTPVLIEEHILTNIFTASQPRQHDNADNKNPSGKQHTRTDMTHLLNAGSKQEIVTSKATNVTRKHR